MDLNKLTVGDRVIVASAVVFAFATLLPWFGRSFVNGFDDGTLNGLDFFLTGLVPLVLILLTAATVLVMAFSSEVKVPELPLPLAQLLLIPSIVATVLVFLRLLFGDGIDFVSLSRKGGIFLALLAGIGVCVGAFLKMQESDDSPTHGTTPPQAF